MDMQDRVLLAINGFESKFTLLKSGRNAICMRIGVDNFAKGIVLTFLGLGNPASLHGESLKHFLQMKLWSYLEQ